MFKQEMIHGQNQPTYLFYENTPTEKEFFWLENLNHRFQGYKYFGEHPEKMLDWLKKMDASILKIDIYTLKNFIFMVSYYSVRFTE